MGHINDLIDEGNPDVDCPQSSIASGIRGADCTAGMSAASELPAEERGMLRAACEDARDLRSVA